MLEINSLTAGYGRATVLDDVSVCVKDGEAITILGPNGAGKSTLMQVIMGMLRARTGTVTFDGERINDRRTTQLVRRGLILCPERRHLFPGMSVKENLMMGAFRRSDRRNISSDLDRMVAMFPVLGPKLRLHAGVLSGGEQQMLAIGRALMSRPRLLLLDEPSLGLAPIIVEQVMREVGNIRQQGVALCVVEQNARAALEVVDRGYVLESGRVVMSGSSSELLSDARVQDAYLGA